MSLSKIDIQKFIETEDIPSLCALVDESLKNGDKAEHQSLFEAISEVINIWVYDFYCQKGGDPSAYPFLQGIEALEALSKKELPTDKGEYLLLCMEYYSDLGDLKRAKQYAEQSEKLFEKAIATEPKDEKAFAHLIHLNARYPTTDATEAQQKFGKALDLLDEAIQISDSFFKTKLYRLYQEEIPPSIRPRVEKERDLFFNECSEKSKKDALFSLRLCDAYMRIIEDVDDSLRPRVEKDFLHFLELSTSCLRSEHIFDYVKAGQIFSKMGAHFERIDFLLLSEELFKKSTTQAGGDSEINSYGLRSMESRAILLEKNNDSKGAKALRQEVRTVYLENWKKHTLDISYLSQANQYLLAYALSTPPSEVSKDLLGNIHSIGLAAENRGEGYYWFPYEHLFWSNILLGQEEEAKLWIGRGYFFMNVLIKDQVKRLLINTEKKCSPQVFKFIQKLATHLDNINDKDTWSGGPDNYKKNKEISLKEIEAWLTKQIK